MSKNDQVSFVRKIFLFFNFSFQINFLRFLFFVTAIVITANAACVDEFFENKAYEILAEEVERNGMPRVYAKCVVEVLKFSKVSQDVTDKGYIFSPNELAEKLYAKAEFAEFVCAVGLQIVFLLIFSVVMTILFVCCVSCFQIKSCRSKSSNVKKSETSQVSNNVPLKVMEPV